MYLYRFPCCFLQNTVLFHCVINHDLRVSVICIQTFNILFKDGSRAEQCTMLGIVILTPSLENLLNCHKYNIENAYGLLMTITFL